MSYSNMTGLTTLCKGTSTPCSAFGLEMTAIIIDSVSIVCNIVHLVVIRNISDMKGTAFMRIIQIMSVVDISSSVSSILRWLCGLRKLFHHSSLLLSAVTSTLLNVPAMWRFYVLVVATINRYTAICLPYRYNSSITTTHTTACCLVLLVACIFALAARNFIFFDELCLDRVAGPSSSGSSGASIYNSGIYTCCSGSGTISLDGEKIIQNKEKT